MQLLDSRQHDSQERGTVPHLLKLRPCRRIPGLPERPRAIRKGLALGKGDAELAPVGVRTLAVERPLVDDDMEGDRHGSAWLVHVPVLPARDAGETRKSPWVVRFRRSAVRSARRP